MKSLYSTLITGLSACVMTCGLLFTGMPATSDEIALLGNITGKAADSNPYHFSLYKQNYALSTFFSIQSDETYRGVVKKSTFRVRTNYDLSDEHGWQATGIKRVVSLGSVYPWATEVDVYDTQWMAMGMIDGQVVSTAAARFSIYNSNVDLVGIAYLDYSLNTYTIEYPENRTSLLPIAELHRHKDAGGLDWWEVTVYDPNQIDERIMRIFAAMASDLQPQIDKYYLSQGN